MTSPLLDPAPPDPERLDAMEASVAALLGTQLEVVLVPAEAVLALEAMARGLGRPGVTALVLETRPYGSQLGRWLAETGAEVIAVQPPAYHAVEPQLVADALRADPEISLVCFVHAEAASGTRNDAGALAALAHEAGALVAVDVVASVGADPVRLDDWAVDLAVIGPQKALAGPAGLSLVAVGERAWRAMADNASAPRTSSLSLIDARARRIGEGDGAIAFAPAPLEALALEAALVRLGEEGLAGVERRHEAAAAASRAGLQALGLEPFAAGGEAARVATTVLMPAGTRPADVVSKAGSGAALSVGLGGLRDFVVRIDHTGRRASLEVVLGALEALGEALGTGAGRREEAFEAAGAAWERAFV